jgi:hypothetical protein
MTLTVGSIGRRKLTRRDDPLDAHALSCKHFGELFKVCASRKIVEKIDHELASGLGHGSAILVRRELCQATLWNFSGKSDVNFLSDNAAPVAPAILDAIVQANEGFASALRR